MTVTEKYFKSNHRSTDYQIVTKGHILNNSINLETMPLISWLQNPQLRSLCQCRSAAGLPQGGSSFFKLAMLPAQMTSRTSIYPYCQKMASASSCNSLPRASTPLLNPLVQDLFNARWVPYLLPGGNRAPVKNLN
jgi:hypothetical protein